MSTFFFGLLLLCGSTLMYEIVLTRLLSVACWYYLAFVSVSMAMFGMTAGALMVQFYPERFHEDVIRRRLAQAALATAISMPLSLLTMLSIPVDVSLAVQTVYSFVLFSAVISVPFFFSGIAVCLSLTRSPFAMGRVYFTDLSGAALGCIASVVLLHFVDAPSGVFVISALLFAGAAAYASYAREARYRKLSLGGAVAMVIVAALNSSTIHGIQPIWSKGAIDRRTGILAEVWNPISKIRIADPGTGAPQMWGPSPRMPRFQVESMQLNIDNDAATSITRFNGDLRPLEFLRYDVTSIAAQLRPGGTAAVIGVGGGRDVLNCALNGFRRIVGIEVNPSIVDLTSRRFDSFSGFSKIPGFELHQDEGRSYLTRSGERFDLIQAALVDTWAATSAGAMTLSENAIYTVEGWRNFYEHLKPGGILTFSRWFAGSEKSQTYRLFSVALATLISEGVTDPERNLALVQSGPVATLLLSRGGFTQEDIQKIKAISQEMEFTPLVLPGQEITIPPLRRIASARSIGELNGLRDENGFDYSPTFDASPYFFNAVHLKDLPYFLSKGGPGANVRAMVFVFAFMVAAAILVLCTILIPATLWRKRMGNHQPAPAGSLAYFIAIGLGFMFVEIGMMQQLSIFLGHAIYSMVVVLAGLILSTGIGSLASDRWKVTSAWQGRLPAIAAGLLVVGYWLVALPIIHTFTAGLLWQRILISLALIAPCGILFGFCFPVGLRWMVRISQERNLPWMWALNGAAGTLGAFGAMVLSMDTSIRTCILTGAGCYVLAGIALPARVKKGREVEQAEMGFAPLHGEMRSTST